MKLTKQAFTLVELIVVITILAVLGTIAFLSFQSYTVYARDVVRLSNLKNIESGLQIQYTQGGNYAVPDDFVNITASGTIIRQQGVFGTNALRTIRANKDASKDPLTEQYYDYVTDAYQSEYQLIGYMESDEAMNVGTSGLLSLQETHASGTGFIMKTLGQDMGIVSTGGVDLHRTEANIGQDFDIANTFTQYTITFNNDSEITGTGQTLITVLGAYDKALAYLDESLTLHYDMESMTLSGSLVVLKDFSKNKKNGVCMNGVNIVSCDEQGPTTEIGKGMSFDGVDDYISIGAISGSVLDFVNKDFTIIFTYRLESDNLGFIIGAAGQGQAPGFRALNIPGEKIRYRLADSSFAYIGDLDSGIGEEISLSYVRDGGNSILYKEGEYYGQYDNQGIDISSPSSFHIGGRVSNWYAYMTMKDVFIYNKALTPDVITAIQRSF